MQQYAVVTGGGDSVGRAIAQAFLARGIQVYVCDINNAALAETMDANENLHGSVINVADRAAVDGFFDQVLAVFPHIDFLVNTVGVGGGRGLIEDLCLDELRDTFAANVEGTLHCMQRVIPSMKARKSGSIVNFSSASTRTCLPSRTAYIATKYAVEGITKNAARELGPYNIRCNAVLPGAIDNARLQRVLTSIAEEEGVTLGDVEARLLKYVSMRAKVTPLEIAEFVSVLCSQKAPHITGQLIGVDGNLEWEI